MSTAATEEMVQETVAIARPVEQPAKTLRAQSNTRHTKMPEKVMYEFTTDLGLLHQYFRLREDMFISVWGLQHFNGEHDEFDDHSHIMVARQGRQCVAGGRLTICNPGDGQKLPMEKENLVLNEMFPALNLEERTYGEFSRLAILPEFRGGVVFPEIARRFIRRAIAEGVEYAFNIAPLPLARSYRQAVQLFGVNWEIQYDVKIPDREEYEGIRMVLSVMDLSQFARYKKAATEGVKSQVYEDLIAE